MAKSSTVLHARPPALGGGLDGTFIDLTCDEVAIGKRERLSEVLM